MKTVRADDRTCDPDLIPQLIFAIIEDSAPLAAAHCRVCDVPRILAEGDPCNSVEASAALAVHRDVRTLSVWHSVRESGGVRTHSLKCGSIR
jgi:hypothetical protein